ncbi:hypothetical protein CYY_005002 [Polysphondylium violaceum]|uniref:Methyltransferase type 11 domain-containing protein n=1 Tax=Polysphondylium violaceum TaxID=133409 RepID=A0A8J4PUZ5_9MYCE|nr:hypothetical protein CYY_005002 [Polysphondylium violaceum]
MSAIKISTSEELEKKWDEFSTSFARYYEPNTLPICFLLISNLGLTTNFDGRPTPKAILEVACGGGAGTEMCLNLKKPETSFDACDISSEMVALTKRRLGMKQEENTIVDKKFTISQCDAERLPYKDNSFDGYFANFCLHLVAKPENMLAEAYRVLEKDGVGAWSVWGRPENSNQFTILRTVAANMGLELKPSPVRSAFHLHDTAKLRQMALDAGFSEATAGYTYCNLMIRNGDEFVQSFFSTPEMKITEKEIGSEKYKEWKVKTAEYVDGLLKSGTFIGLESAYLVVRK